MKTQRLQIKATHPYAYRSGEWAYVDGVCWVTPDALLPRPCYRLIYEDGAIDYMPVNEAVEFRPVPCIGK